VNERELRATLSAILVRADSQRADSATFTASELDGWPTDLRDALIQSRILRRSRPLQAVPCPQCDEDHVVAVEWIDELALAWCPTAGRITIDARLLDSYVVVPGRLAELVHELLGIGEPLQAITPDRLWRLGATSDAKLATEFFLLRGADWGDALLEHPSISRSSDAAVVTLVDVPVAGAIRTMPLARVLTVSGGKFEVDRASALAALAAREPVASPPTLRREGSGWHVSFGDERAAVHDLLGLGYIRLLVRSPLHDFEPEDLMSLVSSPTERVRSADAPEDGLLRDESPAVPVLDRRGRRELASQLTALRDAGQIEAAETLQRHLRQATRPGGRTKTFETPSTKAARNVRRAITRALEALQEQAPHCSLHLHGAIALGPGKPLAYRPEQPLRWATD